MMNPHSLVCTSSQCWRWLGAKELDAANSEPSASSILEIFQPFVYGRLPGQSVSADVGQLHQLLFSDDEQTLNALAQAARTVDPNVKARDFIRFLQERARRTGSSRFAIIAPD